MSTYVGYIYCITNKLNGKQYIGQTNTSVNKRYTEHLRCAGSGMDTTSLLYRAMRKYGTDNFYVDSLECVTSETKTGLKELLNDREIFYVASNGTYMPNGYNMTVGGYAFAAHVTTGVFEVDHTGLVVSHYASLRDAQFASGVDERNIGHACRSKSHFSGNRFWYLDKEFDFVVGQTIGVQSRGKNNWHGRRMRPRKPVDRFTKDGVFIDTFDSASIAAQKLHICQAHISKCCLGSRKTAGGYRWSFTNLNDIKEEVQ